MHLSEESRKKEETGEAGGADASQEGSRKLVRGLQSNLAEGGERQVGERDEVKVASPGRSSGPTGAAGPNAQANSTGASGPPGQGATGQTGPDGPTGATGPTAEQQQQLANALGQAPTAEQLQNLANGQAPEQVGGIEAAGATPEAGQPAAQPAGETPSAAEVQARLTSHTPEGPQGPQQAEPTPPPPTVRELNTRATQAVGEYRDAQRGRQRLDRQLNRELAAMRQRMGSRFTTRFAAEYAKTYRERHAETYNNERRAAENAAEHLKNLREGLDRSGPAQRGSAAYHQQIQASSTLVNGYGTLATSPQAHQSVEFFNQVMTNPNSRTTQMINANGSITSQQLQGHMQNAVQTDFLRRAAEYGGGSEGVRRATSFYEDMFKGMLGADKTSKVGFAANGLARDYQAGAAGLRSIANGNHHRLEHYLKPQGALGQGVAGWVKVLGALGAVGIAANDLTPANIAQAGHLGVEALQKIRPALGLLGAEGTAFAQALGRAGSSLPASLVPGLGLAVNVLNLPDQLRTAMEDGGVGNWMSALGTTLSAGGYAAMLVPGFQGPGLAATVLGTALGLGGAVVDYVGTGWETNRGIHDNLIAMGAPPGYARAIAYDEWTYWRTQRGPSWSERFQ